MCLRQRVGGGGLRAAAAQASQPLKRLQQLEHRHPRHLVLGCHTGAPVASTPLHSCWPGRHWPSLHACLLHRPAPLLPAPSLPVGPVGSQSMPRSMVCFQCCRARLRILTPGRTRVRCSVQLKDEDGLYHTWVDEMMEGCGIDGYENNMQVTTTSGLQLQLAYSCKPQRESRVETPWRAVPCCNTSVSASQVSRFETRLACVCSPFVRWGQIVHYTSDGPLGGWERQQPVSAVTSICAHAIRDPATKKYLIFHTGCGRILSTVASSISVLGYP